MSEPSGHASGNSMTLPGTNGLVPTQSWARTGSVLGNAARNSEKTSERGTNQASREPRSFMVPPARFAQRRTPRFSRPREVDVKPEVEVSVVDLDLLVLVDSLPVDQPSDCRSWGYRIDEPIVAPTGVG